MCGGKLIHHLDGHVSNQHKVGTSCSSKVFDSFTTNSLHHQMCVPPMDGDIINWSIEKQSNKYIGDEDKIINWAGPEVEGLSIPWCKVVGVQWHPELMSSSSKGRTYYLMLIHDLINFTVSEFRSKHTDKVEVMNV